MLTQTSTDVCRYTYHRPETGVYVLLCARNDGNSKTTFNRKIPTVDTTMFSEDQVRENDFELDSKNCGNCPRSYNSRKDYVKRCYTHGGHERIALTTMLSDTHDAYLNGDIEVFDEETFQEWWHRATMYTKYGFLRHGRYGDPYFMDHDMLFRLNDMVRTQCPDASITGYTHQGHQPDAGILFTILQNSVDTRADAEKELMLGESSMFFSSKKGSADMEWFKGLPNTRECPASKAARLRQTRKVSCVDCNGCHGTSANRPHYYIEEH